MSRIYDALKRLQIEVFEETEALSNPAPPSAAVDVATPVGEGAGQAVDPSLLEAISVIPKPEFFEFPLMGTPGDFQPPIEEFRQLRTRLNHMRRTKKLKTLAVTSPGPGEGKSFTSSNLAFVQSQLDRNPTLLADFDLRKPVLHKAFGIDRGPGITEFLQGQADLHDVVRRVEGTELYFLPAGSEVDNPLELLNRPAFNRLMQSLPDIFEWVILDTPPLLVAADANLLSTACDGALLVVRLEQTSIDSLQTALKETLQRNIVGVVANYAEASDLQRIYGSYKYNYSSLKLNGEN